MQNPGLMFILALGTAVDPATVLDFEAIESQQKKGLYHAQKLSAQQNPKPSQYPKRQRNSHKRKHR